MSESGPHDVTESVASVASSSTSTTGTSAVTAAAESPRHAHGSGELLIDCATCDQRDIACHDCVVSVLLGPVGVPVRLVASEGVALDALAQSGLVPPLRHQSRRAM